MRSVRRLLPLLLLLLPAALAAQVGVTTDIISGRVTGPAGQPVAGAQVEAVSDEGGVRRTAATRVDGRYTLVFPDGGGRYRVRVTALGFAPSAQAVAREADEDVLTANFRLSEEAIAIAGVEARASRTPPPSRGETGGQERFLPSDVVNRLPLEDNDPARLAALSPGVVAVTNADSLEARQSFSVGGQRASLNQITLDGTTFASALTGGQAGGGSPLSLPQEGLRGTQVVTNTYDVSRGQFSGGQVSMTTRAGTNNPSGSFSWSLRDPALQAGAGRPSWGGGFTQNRVSGGFGGPVLRDKLFYYVSFAAQRRTDDLYSLTPSDPDVVTGLGVSPDSVSRFLSLLNTRYGVSGRTGEFSRTNDALTLLGRVDYTINQQHTLALRGHLSLSGQDNARIGFLETRENGGEADTDGKGAIATYTARLGGSVVNELRASITDDRREQAPYDQVPEGRVRVSSDLPDGERGVSTLVFGGERSLPTNTRETAFELSEELSFLYRDQHRLKLGGLLNHTSFEQQTTSNRLGSFEFNSLEDFEAGRAARFTRSLSPRVTEGGGVNAAIYLGDTWRPAQRLQLSFGLRGEGSRFDEQPAFNADVLRDFGRRTDDVPTEVHLSPRLGFSWRLNEQGAPLKLVRGGFGEFRGRAPFTLFATALDQTGLSTAQSQLECVGLNVPVPNWSAYESDPNSIPTACANGAQGVPAQVRLPTVTVFDQDFAAPRSWKASLGFQTQLRPRVGISLDLTRTWGVSLFGVRDLNLDTSAATSLPSEADRPFYGDPSRVVAETGAVPLESSRRYADYAQVFEVASNLESRTTQATLGVNGLLLTRLLFSASYTFTRSTDQSSFSSGSPFSGFAQVPVAGDPNRPEWATSDLERKHSFVLTLGWQPSQVVELTVIGRASSGAPFTPLVGGDINGDGARNDRAFVFDPAAAYDPALAAGMERLLDGASGRVADCLTSQRGRIAERNSCRGPWTSSLDLRGTLRPSVPGPLGKRLSVSVDATNLAAGADLLLHGQDGLRGWGNPGFGRDEVLLYPRGFDPVTRRFTYEVNERFGDSRSRRGFASPFQVQLSARVNVGRQQQQGIGGLAAIGFGGAGGDAGRDRGGFTRPGAGGFDAGALLDRLLPEPVSAILLLRDTLGISDEQAARIQAIADSLKAKNEPIREEIRVAVTPPAGGAPQDPGTIFQRIGPRLNVGRQNIAAALSEVQKVLTPEQWRKVPAALRNPLGGFGGAPGGPRGERGNRPGGRPQGEEGSRPAREPATTTPAAPAPAPAPTPAPTP